jgi:hypothetical protein
LFKDILNQVITRTLGAPCRIAPATPRCHHYRPLRSRLERLYHSVLGKTPALAQLPGTPARRILTRRPARLPRRRPDRARGTRLTALPPSPGLTGFVCRQRHRTTAPGDRCAAAFGRLVRAPER